MAINREKIGAFMAALRRKKGLTQAELAERIGVSNKSVSRWETGQTMPDYDQMLKLCALLEVDLNDLLSGEQPAVSADESAYSVPEEKETLSDVPSETMSEPAGALSQHDPKNPGQGKKAVKLWLPIVLTGVLILAGVLLAKHSGQNRAGGILIDETSFPDEDFRPFVQNELAHADPGSFTAAEADAVTVIDCSDRGIKDLTGISSFRKLTELDCSANDIETLDLRENKELRILRCGSNLITSLQANECSGLEVLDCEYNQLSELDIGSF